VAEDVLERIPIDKYAPLDHEPECYPRIIQDVLLSHKKWLTSVTLSSSPMREQDQR